MDKCKTCKWFWGDRSGVGGNHECRFKAPTLSESSQYVWPRVSIADGCGDHETNVPRGTAGKP